MWAMMTRMLVVAASMAGLLKVDAAPVLGRAAPSPPEGRNTDGGPGMGENYTCSLQWSGQFGHSPCVAFPPVSLRSFLSLVGVLGRELVPRACYPRWSFVFCAPSTALELKLLVRSRPRCSTGNGASSTRSARGARRLTRRSSTRPPASLFQAPGRRPTACRVTGRRCASAATRDALTLPCQAHRAHRAATQDLHLPPARFLPPARLRRRRRRRRQHRHRRRRRRRHRRRRHRRRR